MQQKEKEDDKSNIFSPVVFQWNFECDGLISNHFIWNAFNENFSMKETWLDNLTVHSNHLNTRCQLIFAVETSVVFL